MRRGSLSLWRRLEEAKTVKFSGSYLNIASGVAVIEYVLEAEEGEVGSG